MKWTRCWGQVTVRQATSKGISQRRACDLYSVSRSMLGYEHKMPVKDAVLKDKLEQVARENTSWGYRVVAGHLAILGEPVGISRAQAHCPPLLSCIG